MTKKKQVTVKAGEIVVVEKKRKKRVKPTLDEIHKVQKKVAMLSYSFDLTRHVK